MFLRLWDMKNTENKTFFIFLIHKVWSLTGAETNIKGEKKDKKRQLIMLAATCGAGGR